MGVISAFRAMAPIFIQTPGAGLLQKQYDKKIQGKLPFASATSVPSDQFVKRSARVTFGSQTTTASVSPQEKLSRMAQQLSSHQLDAYYVSPEDEHLNEYLPDTKKRIEWLTHFTGESAPLLVTPTKMHLFVDGRFFLQVDEEVDPSVVVAHKVPIDGQSKDNLPNTLKDMAQQHTAQKPLRVGYDPFIVSPARLKGLTESLGNMPVQWVPIQGNLVDPTWSGRPPLPATQGFSVDEALTGRSVKDKLASIRETMKTLQADILPITRLDDVAWVYNIRGGDIPYNPVLESYSILTHDQAYLFAPPNKIPSDLKKHLESENITVKPYDEYQKTLESLVSGSPKSVLIDKDSVTLGTLNIVENASATVVEASNPITQQKALKNKTEIEKMLLANFRASRAIIRHLVAMEDAFAQGQKLSEVTVRDDLETKYKQEPEFYDLSFPTIPGIGTNSAIIHYSKADPKNIAKDGDFYLLDSGCQYMGGTTDTTRTTVMGAPSTSQIQRYTAVLKGHIACANLRFPEGTKGVQIDTEARKTLWSMGLDYAHGTGHGVGAFLNVHEGPNRINTSSTVTFKPGMVTSIEPGYYEANWGGIRLENLYYVAEDSTKPDFLGKKWLKFEPLTFVPFEKKLIDVSALTKDEYQWLAEYNQKVWEKLSPTLSPPEQAWLKEQCSLAPKTP